MPETVSLEKVYEELKKIEKDMATKRDVEDLMETIEVVNNPETMKQIIESEKAIKQGKIKEIHSVQDMIDEM